MKKVYRSYKEVVGIVEKYDKKLLATNDGFRKCVSLTHEDGSIFLWQNAFVMKFENWIVVFTEHYGYHIFDESDIEGYCIYKRDYSELKEIK